MSRKNGKFKILLYGEYFLPGVGGVQTAMNLPAKAQVDLNTWLEKIGAPWISEKVSE
jgi:hypothetical protein